MAASSSISLLDVMEWAKRLNFSRRSALGNNLEPATTSANIVMQTILGAPFAWRWNRAVIGFITLPGQQDYTVFNYLASTNVKLGWFTVDDAGNSQHCTTAGTTGTSVSWNHTPGGTTTDGGVTWTNLGPLNNAEVQGSYTFNWIETSSVQDAKLGWKEMTSKLVLGLASEQGRPLFLCGQTDDGLGNVTFRMMPTPGVSYPVVITLQQKPPIFIKTSQLITPIPNEYARIFQWGFLSLMWLFADDPRFNTANSKFIASLLSTAEGLSDTERNIFLTEWQQIAGTPAYNGQREQQATQARGT